MKNYLSLAILVLTCAASCKKDNVEPAPAATPAPAVANGYPLTVGSYWIYENTDIDSNNMETVNAANPSDSCYILKDTIMNGKTYKMFVGSIANPFAVFFRRDSSGFMVDEYGIIFYSKTDFIHTLRSWSIPGYLEGDFKMVGPPTSVTVPSGTYAAYDYQGMIVFNAGYPWMNPRYAHSYYANGVGLVRETTFFTGSPNYVARRLLRYHIQ
jgi:hypothetical protein